MKKEEREIDELVNELRGIVEEIKIALGKQEKVVMGMKVKRSDYQQLWVVLPALERVLKEYSQNYTSADEEFMSLVASFDPESQKILEVYKPSGWRRIEDGEE